MVKSEKGPDLKAVVAENVKRLKDYRKKTQGQIAKDAGVSQSSVGRVLAGAVAADLDTLSGIAKALGVQAWQLLIPAMQPDNPPVLRSVDRQEEALYERMRAAAAELVALQKKGGT